MDYYSLTISGLTRQLPLIFVGRKTRIASLNILGDGQLVNKTAAALVKKLKNYSFDYLVGPEVKVVPLLSELARLLHRDRFIVCRKSVKPYMVSPVVLKPLPNFPKHVRPLVLDGPDATLLSGKTVAIVDDVVSTGVTIRMVTKLMEKVGAQISVIAAILKQGTQFDPIANFIYLEELTVFKENP